MFRFTIRDVLWLTVVVAILAGWYVDHRRGTAREAAWVASFQSALEQLAFHAQQEALTFDTPSGKWEIHCTTGVSPP